MEENVAQATGAPAVVAGGATAAKARAIAAVTSLEVINSL